MARPKKVNTDIMSDEMVEVKSEGRTNVAEPNLVEAKVVEDVVPELTVEVVKAKPVEQDKVKVPIPICDIEELTEDDKQVLIEKRIKTIISQTQVPYIPALIRYKEPGTTSVPPMFALVDFDHRYVSEGWEFYKTNVRNPYVKDYLLLIYKVMNKPNKIFTRLVTFNYE